MGVMFPVAIHVSTITNEVVDELSCMAAQNHKWELDTPNFHMICERWGYPIVNMFTTNQNTTRTMFCSHAGRGHNSLGDAFMIHWTTDLLYLFPPIPLIQWMIVKIRQVGANVFLTAPYWPHQPWFTTLRQIATDSMKLPLLPHLFTQNTGNIYHPDLRTIATSVGLENSPLIQEAI